MLVRKKQIDQTIVDIQNKVPGLRYFVQYGTGIKVEGKKRAV